VNITVFSDIASSSVTHCSSLHVTMCCSHSRAKMWLSCYQITC